MLLAAFIVNGNALLCYFHYRLIGYYDVVAQCFGNQFQQIKQLPCIAAGDVY